MKNLLLRGKMLPEIKRVVAEWRWTPTRSSGIPGIRLSSKDGVFKKTKGVS